MEAPLSRRAVGHEVGLSTVMPGAALDDAVAVGLASPGSFAELVQSEAGESLRRTGRWGCRNDQEATGMAAVVVPTIPEGLDGPGAAEEQREEEGVADDREEQQAGERAPKSEG